MKQANIVSVYAGQSLPTFAVAETHEYFWLLLDCYESVALRKNMADEGFVYQQIEATDISDAESMFDSLSSYTKTWISDAFSAQASGQDVSAFDHNYIPDLINLAVFILTGNWGAVFVLFIKVGIEFLFDFTEKEKDPGLKPGDTAQVLTKLFGVLDSETQEIIGSTLEGLTNLHITINSPDDVQDFEWSSGASP